MSENALQDSSVSTSRAPILDHDHLRDAIEKAGQLLPTQGPITVFVSLNTLQSFENMPFDEGVKKGARIFGCQPYLNEDRYREDLGRGRIRFLELRAVLREDLGERAFEGIAPGVSRLELRLAMLQYSLKSGTAEELRWFVAEMDALRKLRTDASYALRKRLIAETRRWVMRDLRGGNESSRNGTSGNGRRRPAWITNLFERFEEATIETWTDDEWEAFTLQTLWQVCYHGVRDLPSYTSPQHQPIRHRDALLEATGFDIDVWVHNLMIRFSAAFLDQGVAHWELPDRDLGLYQAFCSLYRRPGGLPDLWLLGLADELGQLQDRGVSPLESIRESLKILGVPESEWDEFISETAIALRGWAGMVRQVEVRGDRVAHPIPPGSLIEFIAIRLLLDRYALKRAARDTLGYCGPLDRFRDSLKERIGKPPTPGPEQRAFLVFQMAEVLGWTPDELHRMTNEEWGGLVREIEEFSSLERRRIFQLAFERRFVIRALDALALHQSQGDQTSGVPEFQAVLCLDDREESFRRHLEEVAPNVETFGAAGFFGVAIYYRGAGEAHFVPLCPIVIRPNHWVAEQVDESVEGIHRRREMTRRALGRMTHQFHVGSRSFALGALLTAGLGALAGVPLVARILAPRLSARIRRAFGHAVRVPQATRLRLERKNFEPGPEKDRQGFSLGEMIDISQRLLQDIGLTRRFAPLVFVFGHGSSSLNNPHKSAYDCGACGGGPGAPNSRSLAQFLNDPRVREGLECRGLVIPPETWFIGGLHNTCNESVTFFDIDRLPETHRVEFESARRKIDATLDRNAHERCRRFMSAPLTLSFSAARQHVEARSEDLAQTRPEYGHSTNALCVVGRRSRTRGLFLDRRAFLTSYDPTQDDAEASILTRILQAAVPVCSGINLQYFFSYVDSPGWGSGSKLPHNITSLIGVMDGAASDLRTGLSRQMVEIHEPVRLVMVVETSPETILRIMEKNPAIGQVIRNGWVHMAVLDPGSSRVQLFREGAFHDYSPQSEELPEANSSVDWYRGWRDHLEFAEIRP